MRVLRRAGPTLLCMALLGCGGSSPAATVLQLWAMGREGEVVEQMMPAFEARHPGVHVRVQQIPWSAAHEKLLTAFVGDAMPDVFQAGNTWLPELAALAALEPLDERLARAGVPRDDFFPGILDTNVVGGVAVGVPWYVDTRLLFYRRDLLADAGVSAPPRTWSAWVDVMTRVRARGGSGRRALLAPVREWQLPVVLALQQGAELLRDGDRYGNFESPPVVRAFDFYLDLFHRDLASRAGETELTNLYQDFAGGYFAFLVTGPWNLGEFARRLPAALADAWATAPLPAPDGTPYPGVSLAGGASLAVARGGRLKDEAWELVAYLTDPARQVEFHRLTGDLPARRSAWHDAGLVDDPRAGAFWTQLDAVRSTPKVPEWERIASLIGRYAESAVRGDLPADAARAALDRDVDALLEKRRWLLDRGA